MIEDREIWACAHQVMRQYGDVAWLHAAQRADELLASCDHEGYRVWMRILKHIEDLEKLESKGRLQ